MIEFKFEKEPEPNVIIITACYDENIIGQYGYALGPNHLNFVAKRLNACTSSEEQRFTAAQMGLAPCDFKMEIDGKQRPAIVVYHPRHGTHYTSASGEKCYIDVQGALHENGCDILTGDALAKDMEAGQKHPLFGIAPFHEVVKPDRSSKFPLQAGYSCKLDF